MFENVKNLKNQLPYDKVKRFKCSSFSAVFPRCFKNFCCFAYILPFISLRKENTVKKILKQQLTLYHFALNSKFTFQLFANGHLNKVVSTLVKVLTLVNVVKLIFQNDNLVSTLSNVVHIMLFQKTLIKRCSML